MAHLIRTGWLHPFQAEVAAIPDCVTSCPIKRLVKEQITICTDSQAAVATLAASGTKSLLVADHIEKLTVLSEINQVTIMRVFEHSGIQQNETRILPTTILKQI